MALAVVSFSIVTCLNFKIPISGILMLFIFYGTVTGYNFVKYGGAVYGSKSSRVEDFSKIKVLTAITFICLIFTMFFQSFNVLLVAGFLGLITILYALPVFPKNKNLRAIPGLKIYIIVFVVAGVTVILPLIPYLDNFHPQDIIIEFIQRCLIAIVLILPFEIRDLKQDTDLLETIPQKYGIKKTKQIGYLLIGTACFLEFGKEEFHLNYLISLGALSIMAFIFLKYSIQEQNEFYSSFWVEAAPFFWLIVLLMLDLIT